MEGKKESAICSPQQNTGEQKGILSKSVETVSATIQGTAEGLQHGAHVLTHPIASGIVQGKELARENIHQMTEEPTPRNPSYLDQARQAVVPEKNDSPPFAPINPSSYADQARQAWTEAQQQIDPNSGNVKEKAREKLHAATAAPNPRNPSLADRIKESLSPEQDT